MLNRPVIGISPPTSCAISAAHSADSDAHPTEQNTPLPDMIESVTKQPFEDLKVAIDRRDDEAFGKGYDELSEACNSCHQALNHGTVVIGRPAGASQSDLIFGKAGR